MSESVELAVLARYFEGTASAAERAQVEDWIGTEPGRRATVAQLQAAWLADANRLDAPFDVVAAWTRVSRQLERGKSGMGQGRGEVVARLPLAAAKHGERVAQPERSRRRWPAARIARWAAAVVLALGAGGALWLSPALRRSPPSEQPVAMREYAAARGQRAIVRLLDGTEVTLNVDSRLRVPQTFGDGRRDVHLEGEAYFTVVHDSTRPFAVHTARGVTRDLGTRFGVRAYADETDERVVVAEGAVTIASSPTAAAVVLRAGQGATLLASDSVTVRDADPERELAWTRGRLEFDRTPLVDVARHLGRWYDLDVRVADPALAQREVTGSYGDEPIAHVLTVITAAVGASYDWRGRTVTITPAP